MRIGKFHTFWVHPSCYTKVRFWLFSMGRTNGGWLSMSVLGQTFEWY